MSSRRMAFGAALSLLAGLVAAAILVGPAAARSTDADVKLLVKDLRRDLEALRDRVRSQGGSVTVSKGDRDVDLASFVDELLTARSGIEKRLGPFEPAAKEVVTFLSLARLVDERHGREPAVGEAWPVVESRIAELARIYGIDFYGPASTWAPDRMNDVELEGLFERLETDSAALSRSLGADLDRAGASKDEKRALLLEVSALQKSAAHLEKRVSKGIEDSELVSLEASFDVLASSLSDRELGPGSRSAWEQAVGSYRQMRAALGR